MPGQSEYEHRHNRLRLGGETTTAWDGGMPDVETAGGGTGSAPIVGTRARNFMEFRFQSEYTGTDGDIRGLYLRHYINGGSGGEAARVFTTVRKAIGTAHGAHISLNYDISPAATSGLAVAMRGTLHMPNRASSIGTAAAVQAEVYMDGTSADPTGKLSLFRGVIDGGDATAKSKVDYLMELVGLQSNVFNAHVAADSTHSLKIDIGGTDYYIMLTNVAPA